MNVKCFWCGKVIKPHLKIIIIDNWHKEPTKYQTKITKELYKRFFCSYQCVHRAIHDNSIHWGKGHIDLTQKTKDGGQN